MVQAFWHLCGRAWTNLLAALSTSTLSVVVLSILLPTVTFSSTLLYRWRQSKRSGQQMNLKASLIPTSIAAGVALLFWIVLFGWSMTKTVYDEHKLFVTTNNALIQEVDRLGKQNKSLESQRDILQSGRDTLKLANDRLRARTSKSSNQNPPQSSQDERERNRTETRKAIRLLLGEGENIQQVAIFYPRMSYQTLVDMSNKWGSKTSKELETRLGSDYEAQFSSTAVLLSFSPGRQPPEPNAKEKAELWGALNNRLTRLNQFLQELRP